MTLDAGVRASSSLTSTHTHRTQESKPAPGRRAAELHRTAAAAQRILEPARGVSVTFPAGAAPARASCVQRKSAVSSDDAAAARLAELCERAAHRPAGFAAPLRRCLRCIPRRRCCREGPRCSNLREPSPEPSPEHLLSARPTGSAGVDLSRRWRRPRSKAAFAVCPKNAGHARERECSPGTNLEHISRSQV